MNPETSTGSLSSRRNRPELSVTPPSPTSRVSIARFTDNDRFFAAMMGTHRRLGAESWIFEVDPGRFFSL